MRVPARVAHLDRASLVVIRINCKRFLSMLSKRVCCAPTGAPALLSSDVACGGELLLLGTRLSGAVVKAGLEGCGHAVANGGQQKVRGDSVAHLHVMQVYCIDVRRALLPDSRVRLVLQVFTSCISRIAIITLS